MAYVEALPSSALQPWVECFWRHDGGDRGERRVLPDGAADIIVPADGVPFVVGPMTRALVVPGGGSPLSGIRFRPGRAARVLGVPLGSLTDARVPLRDVQRTLVLDPSLPVVPSFETMLARRLAAVAPPDPRVLHAVTLLTRGVAVEDAALATGLTRQHLRRRFLDEVGLAPKTFARVMRLQRLVAAVRRRTVRSWADAALLHGWADQAHLVTDFHDLAGITPAAMFHSSKTEGARPR